MFEAYFYVLFAILGLFVGSYLNVLIFRLGSGLSAHRGRSMCLSCGHNLNFFDLVPILSFAFLWGKCRYCKSSISIQYPIIEMMTALAFLSIALWGTVLNIAQLLVYFAIFSILIVVFVYDLKHKIIPDVLSFLFAGFSLINLILFTNYDLISLLAGPILFLPFYFLWKISKGRWIGLGDGKLAIGVGWLFGLSAGVSALVWAFWFGAVFSLFILSIKKIFGWSKIFKLTIKSEIPFAPFIIFGILFQFFFNLHALNLF